MDVDRRAAPRWESVDVTRLRRLVDARVVLFRGCDMVSLLCESNLGHEIADAVLPSAPLRMREPIGCEFLDVGEIEQHLVQSTREREAQLSSLRE